MMRRPDQRSHLRMGIPVAELETETKPVGGVGICQVKNDFINRLLRERGYTRTRVLDGQSVVSIRNTPFPVADSAVQ
jgi:hypothetical protein